VLKKLDNVVLGHWRENNNVMKYKSRLLLPATPALLVTAHGPAWRSGVDILRRTMPVAFVITAFIASVIALLLIVVEDDESTYHSWYPATEGEQEYNEKRATTLVNNGKRWKYHSQ
jgi:hypothetical protein